MTTIASLYNSLPTIEDADANFVERTTLFSKLAPLLAAYQYKFGVCLVHAHCKLEEGEKMVSSGNISQPEIDTECYPERWLASGEAYEFSKEPMETPPPELFDQFRDIVGGTNLGIYAASGTGSGGTANAPHSGVQVLREWTEGRRNITLLVESDAVGLGDIETGWIPGSGNPTTMVCVAKCVKTDSGHAPVHSGKSKDDELDVVESL